MMDIFTHGLATPPMVELTEGYTVARLPLMEDWAAWAEVRAASRDFLVPWEPSWPPDSLTRGAWQRRLRRQYDDWKHDLAYSFLIFRKRDNQLVGGISLNNVRRGVSQMASLGYWLGQPYARHGHMTRAATAVLTYAFETLSLHRIEAGTIPSNLPSRGLLKKLGFTEEGFARGYYRINGNWADHVLFGMLRDEWAAKRTKQTGR